MTRETTYTISKITPRVLGKVKRETGTAINVTIKPNNAKKKRIKIPFVKSGFRPSEDKVTVPTLIVFTKNEIPSPIIMSIKVYGIMRKI